MSEAPDHEGADRTGSDHTGSDHSDPDHTGNDQAGRGDTFVVQEHHARALHWDVRLERDGVLVSWAVPKGLPPDPATNHLAKHVEDHDLAHATFEGSIGHGEYGAGQVTVWDKGTYTLEKWTDDEVKVVLAGERVQGRYVFFRTSRSGATPSGKQGSAKLGPRKGGSARYGSGPDDWMVHRMDPPTDPDWRPAPERVAPMLAVPGALPPDGAGWAYEVKWDGVRVVVHVAGGRVRAVGRSGRDVTVAYPELRAIGPALGSTRVVLDGEVVAFGPDGNPDFGRLQHRMHVAAAATARRLATTTPVSYLAFDLLYLDGHDTTGLPYDARRRLLEGLPGLTVPPSFTEDGAAVLAASRKSGLEGVVAKRRTSTYQPGRRSGDWVKVKNVRRQSVVIGGWEPGEGRREDTVGALLVGLPADDGRLAYAGQVGTGFSDATLARLLAALRPLRTDESPFAEVPREYGRHAVWVRPELVAEVDYVEWTADGRLRHPSFKGLRDDLAPTDVVREADPLAETQPAETQPAETQPAETQAAETQAAEAQPAETPPTDPTEEADRG